MSHLCDRCGEPIEGEAKPIAPDSGSGAAPTVYVHPHPCRSAAPHPTAPSGLGA
ncbi:hypothetical protein ACGFZL_24355 [Streptomyces sp. NPDC048182]|uniref:hypothetical protein n=1 Tax=unclassified Streptomyces TaxID=2593676 RepID=UPI00339DBC85